MEQLILELPKNLFNQAGEIAKAHGEKIDVWVQKILKDYLKTQSTPSLSPLERSRAIHAIVKANMAEKYPHLKKQRSQKEVQERFDKITEKIRLQMQYETLEELEKIMRGDELGLVRY